MTSTGWWRVAAASSAAWTSRMIRACWAIAMPTCWRMLWQTPSSVPAAALGDIGKLFPDTDPAYEGADSLVLLARVMEHARGLGYEFVDADCTLACQEPKITPHREAMRENLARASGCPIENVGVKATTTERLGWEGEGEGIGAWAVCLLERCI